MEVLRLLKGSSTLVHPPQEVPVDLTTGAKICPSSLLQQRSYPHLRFHSKHYGLVGECLPPVKCEKIILDKMKVFTENECFSQIKAESHSVVEGQKEYAKRRRIEDPPKCEFHSTKRRKVEPENSKDDFKQGIKDDVKGEKYLKYFPLKYSPDQHFPLSVLEHASLMERLKNSKTSGNAASIKEIESLLAAVQQSQMLYYSYCAKLLQNLQARKIIGEHEQLSKTFSGYTSRKDSVGKEYEKSISKTSELMKEAVNAQTCVPHNIGASCQRDKSSCHRSDCSTSQAFRSSLSTSISHQTSQLASSAEDEMTTVPSLLKEGTKSSPGRRRAPRALTGKHVRPGTGASPSTLRTLRQKLEERRRMRSVKGQLGADSGSGVGVRR